MSWNNVIPRANLPVSYEGSPLQSRRESNSPSHLWKRANSANRRGQSMTNFASQVMQRLNAARRPNFAYAYSIYHPFALYNFPSAMRQKQNDDDWQRLKVRFGFLGSDNAHNSGQYNIPAGCDLVPDAAGNPNTDPTNEVFLTTEVPPSTNATFVATGPGAGWHEFKVPVDDGIYYFWATVSLYQFIATEDLPIGILVGKTNANCYSLQSGTAGLNDIWPTFPQNDPYHFLIGSAFITSGVMTVTQFQFDTINFSRAGLDTGAVAGSTYTNFRGEWSSSLYYYAGDIVQLTDNTPGIEIVKNYIMFPRNIGDGGVYGPEFGPIININPGGLNTPDPWTFLSASPTVEALEFASGAYDAAKKYLREI